MGSLIWEHQEEEELVQLAQLGNLQAFNALVARYRPGALVLAKQIVQPVYMAEDAVQDSFLTAFKALPQLENPGKFASWLGAIVRRRSFRISAGEKPGHVPLDDVILRHTPSVYAEVERRAESETVQCALSRLSDDVRPIMELYYLEEWDVGRISGFLALPRSTVKWRLHAGRNLLKGALAVRLENLNESGK